MKNLFLIQRSLKSLLFVCGFMVVLLSCRDESIQIKVLNKKGNVKKFDEPIKPPRDTDEFVLSNP